VIAAKIARKDRKQLQFYDGFGNLMKSEVFAVSLSGVYGKLPYIKKTEKHGEFKKK
jgi:hypothetical protein